MSGGHFDYMQYHFNDIANEILELIRNNEKGWESYSGADTYEIFGYNENGEIREKPEGWQRYSNKTIKQFQLGYAMCRMAGVFAQRIDWLVSDDDGEESFYKRLTEELDKVNEEIEKLDKINWNRKK